MTLTLEPKPVHAGVEFVATIRSPRDRRRSSRRSRASSGAFSSKPGIRSARPAADPDRPRSAASLDYHARIAGRRTRGRPRICHTANHANEEAAPGQEAVSLAELEQAETAHKNAEAQLTAVRSQIKENEVQLQCYRVIAPVAGIVGEIPVREGDRVTTATPITTIDQAGDSRRTSTCRSSGQPS